MSYQVIARKWRPKAFDELVGQSHISQTLLNALKNGRLPHALLFTGPRGTGKTSSARILAKALRCPNAKDFVPCNECSDCLDISSGRSLDVAEIDGASNNGVDAIRELRDTVGYMPSSGKYKLYIIDEVHMLSTSAFNALLKTLEEPPEHVIFVLATTEVHKIPNTILSRCQRFDFRRIPVRAVSECLQNICQKEGVEADPEALWMIARQGDGSMRDSQSLLDQVITFCEGRITLQKVVDVLGLTDRELLTSTIEALVSRDTHKIVSIIEQIFVAGFDPKVFAQDLLEELRNLLMVKLCPDNSAQVVDLPDSEIDHLTQLAQSLSQEDVHLLFDMALKGANDIGRSQDARVVLEMLMLRMAAAPRIESLVAHQSGNLSSAGAGSGSQGITPSSAPAIHNAGSQSMASAQKKTFDKGRRTSQSNSEMSASLADSPMQASAPSPVNKPVDSNPADTQADAASRKRNATESGTTFDSQRAIAPTSSTKETWSKNQTTTASQASSVTSAKNSTSTRSTNKSSTAAASATFETRATGKASTTAASTASAMRVTNTNTNTNTNTPTAARSTAAIESPRQPASTVAAAQSGNTQAKSSGDPWHDLVNKIIGVNPLMGANLGHCYLIENKNKHLVLGVPAKMKFLFGQINSDDFIKKLTNYIATFWGPGYSVEARAGGASEQKLSPKALEEKRRQEKHQAVREQVQNHPLVKSAQEVFKSEIKSIKEL